MAAPNANIPQNNPDFGSLEGPILVDDHQDSSGDDGFNIAEELRSLKSSIVNYEYENGRRYHAYNSGKYILPNDESEQDRLDLHHHIYLLVLDGRLTTAPVHDRIERVLDIGTGTGIWAIDFADTYPEAEVIGTDLSPIQPSWVPPNCRFEIDDAEQEWLWSNNHFDFIHSRNLTQSIRDWSAVAQNMFRCTKPGGYVELVENEPYVRCDDGTLPESSQVTQLMALWRHAAAQMGLAQPTGVEMKELLEAVGFVNVQLTTIKQPFGVWPREEKMKEIGQGMLLFAEKSYHTYCLALFTRVIGMTPEDANLLCDGAVKETFNKKYHSYLNVWYIVGRKPTEIEA